MPGSCTFGRSVTSGSDHGRVGPVLITKCSRGVAGHQEVLRCSSLSNHCTAQTGLPASPD